MNPIPYSGPVSGPVSGSASVSVRCCLSLSLNPNPHRGPSFAFGAGPLCLVPLVLLALTAGGNEILAGAGCTQITVSGGGYEGTNGVYDLNTEGDYSGPPEYSSANGAKLFFYTDTPCLRGWGLYHDDHHRYHDGMHRLDPTIIPTGDWVMRTCGLKPSQNPVPSLRCSGRTTTVQKMAPASFDCSTSLRTCHSLPLPSVSFLCVAHSRVLVCSADLKPLHPDPQLRPSTPSR